VVSRYQIHFVSEIFEWQEHPGMYSAPSLNSEGTAVPQLRLVIAINALWA
jgi:hypothetical protein